MPTVEEKRIIDSSRLDSLISKLMEAVKANDNAEIEQVKDEINAFKLNTFFVDLQKRAREVVDDVSLAQIDVAITELSAIATRVSTYADAIKAAKKIAEEGKESLLLPMLASQTGRMVQLLTALKEASEAVRGQLDYIDGFEDIPGAIEDALSSIKDLESKVQAIT